MGPLLDQRHSIVDRSESGLEDGDNFEGKSTLTFFEESDIALIRQVHVRAARTRANAASVEGLDMVKDEQDKRLGLDPDDRYVRMYNAEVACFKRFGTTR